MGYNNVNSVHHGDQIGQTLSFSSDWIDLV